MNVQTQSDREVEFQYKDMTKSGCSSRCTPSQREYERDNMMMRIRKSERRPRDNQGRVWCVWLWSVVASLHVQRDLTTGSERLECHLHVFR